MPVGVLEAERVADLGLGHEAEEQRRRRAAGGAGRQPAQMNPLMPCCS